MSRKIGAPGLGREWIINFLNGDGFLSFPNLRQYYLTQMCRFLNYEILFCTSRQFRIRFRIRDESETVWYRYTASRGYPVLP